MNETDDRTGTERSSDVGAKHVLLAAWCVFLALATACAPAVAPARTVVVDGAPVDVRAGETIRAVVAQSYGAFGLRPGDLDPLPLPDVIVTPREDVTWAFVQRGAHAPEDWTVRLDRVERLIESLEEAGSAFSLRVTLRIVVPRSADPGAYRVAALVRAPGAGQGWVEVTVRVDEAPSRP